MDSIDTSAKEYLDYFFFQRSRAYRKTIPLTFALCLALLLLFERLFPSGEAGSNPLYFKLVCMVMNAIPVVLFDTVYLNSAVGVPLTLL